jgi:uncharacterized protein (DUF3084 family)
MATMAFDSLRYARRLREVGMPEPQADAQAELMAEAFGFYAENLLTRDHFTEVLNARFSEFRALMDQRFAEQDARIDKRFAEQDARFAAQDARMDRLEERMDRLEDSMGRLEHRVERVEESIQQLTRLSTRIERTQFVHTWVLGVGVAALLLPQLQAWFV